MTSTQLEKLAEWHEQSARYEWNKPGGDRSLALWHDKAAAMLRKMAEQNPVAFKDTCHTEDADGAKSSEALLLGYEGWESLPDGTDLYAAPVAAITAEHELAHQSSLSYPCAITAEQKAEAIYAWCSGREWIEPTNDGPVCMIPVALLSDLTDYLDKIGGK
jgi:hypothetical protein